MTSGDIIDRFGDELSEEDLKYIENILQSVSGMDATMTDKMKYYHDSVADTYFRNSFLQNSNEEGSYGKAKSED